MTTLEINNHSDHNKGHVLCVRIHLCPGETTMTTLEINNHSNPNKGHLICVAIHLCPPARR